MRLTPFSFLVSCLAGWVNRHQAQVIDYLQEENRILREHLQGSRLRFTKEQRVRLAAKAKALGRKVLRLLDTLVTPDTLMRWYRELVAQKYDGSQRRRPGRHPTRQDIVALVIRMARENPRWGYTRIRDALSNLGHEIGRTTIQTILRSHGLEPAPERSRKASWSTFLRSHWDGISAADFFTVEVLTLFGLVRYHVLFVMRLKTRHVEIAGISAQPASPWMDQVVRNLTDTVDGFLRKSTHLILDRDPLYTQEFRRRLRQAGIEPVRLPAKSPNLNAYAERFVLSIKSECLDCIIPLGERHLRRAIHHYMEHYHRERNHQGLDGRLLAPANNNTNTGPIECQQRLGGLLRYYRRKAA